MNYMSDVNDREMGSIFVLQDVSAGFVVGDTAVRARRALPFKRLLEETTPV
jgi:hypothetical protein